VAVDAVALVDVVLEDDDEPPPQPAIVAAQITAPATGRHRFSRIGREG
jgi:hypothetical protein